MTALKKILLHRLPRPVEEALEEQLVPSDWAVEKNVQEKSGHDIVITMDASADFPGCPVLVLNGERPMHLGSLLRQVHRMLLEPVLHLGDIAVGPYIFRPQEKILLEKDGSSITLTDREADLLAYLARRRGQAVGRDELLKKIWQYHDGADTHTLETHIYRLRQKMGLSASDEGVLATEAGGYALRPENPSEG